MEFRLVYKGPLPPEGRTGGHADEKHAIRKAFHKQFAELWKQHPRLQWQLEKTVAIGIDGRVRPSFGAATGKTIVEQFADQYARCGYRFVPMVRKDSGAVCALEILFLRRDNPGSIIKTGGDIDNRIKVLFDGLKMPTKCDELGQYTTPEPGEDPFYCLLEDDSLVADVRVITDRLLIPKEPIEHIHDVELVVLVKTQVVDHTGFLYETLL